MRLKDVAKWKYRGVREYWFDKNGRRHRSDGGPAVITQDEMTWYRHSIQHREDGPSSIRDGNKFTWMVDGNYHRKDGPALDVPKRQQWSLRGVMHRDPKDGPAATMWFDDSRQMLHSEQWVYNNMNVPGPDGFSYRSYYATGVVQAEFCDINEYGSPRSILHREDGPALINYYDNGQIKEKRYMSNGKAHRTTGPAWIDFNKDGSVDDIAWFLDGTSYGEYYDGDGNELELSEDMPPPEDFLKIVKKYPKWGD